MIPGTRPFPIDGSHAVLRKPLTPAFRATRCVEDTQNVNRFLKVLAEYRVGKLPCQNAAVFLMDLRMHFGHAADVLDAGVDATEKLFSQADALVLVPPKRQPDIFSGFWCDDEFSSHVVDEPGVSLRPNPSQSLGCSSSWPVDVPAPQSANRARGHPRGAAPDRPRDLPPVGVSLRDSDQIRRLSSGPWAPRPRTGLQALTLPARRRSLVTQTVPRPLPPSPARVVGSGGCTQSSAG